LLQNLEAKSHGIKEIIAAPVNRKQLSYDVAWLAAWPAVLDIHAPTRLAARPAVQSNAVDVSSGVAIQMGTTRLMSMKRPDTVLHVLQLVSRYVLPSISLKSRLGVVLPRSKEIANYLLAVPVQVREHALLTAAAASPTHRPDHGSFHSGLLLHQSMGMVKALASEDGDPHVVSVKATTALAPDLAAAPTEGDMFGGNTHGKTVYNPILRASDFSIARNTGHKMRMNSRNGATVVSGGLGGLGALVARWLALIDSCQDVILVGRNAHYQLASPAFGLGNVTVVKGDMGFAESNAALSQHGLLHSFHHAAGLLVVSSPPICA
jgi:hypothetical protein